VLIDLTKSGLFFSLSVISVNILSDAKSDDGAAA
jgi:hypothetical protein